MIRTFRVEVKVPNLLKPENVKSALEYSLEDAGWDATVLFDEVTGTNVHPD